MSKNTFNTSEVGHRSVTWPKQSFCGWKCYCFICVRQLLRLERFRTSFAKSYTSLFPMILIMVRKRYISLMTLGRNMCTVVVDVRKTKILHCTCHAYTHNTETHTHAHNTTHTNTRTQHTRKHTTQHTQTHTTHASTHTRTHTTQHNTHTRTQHTRKHTTQHTHTHTTHASTHTRTHTTQHNTHTRTQHTRKHTTQHTHTHTTHTQAHTHTRTHANTSAETFFTLPVMHNVLPRSSFRRRVVSASCNLL